MKRNTIRALIILATISILGIAGVQVYWFNRAFDAEEERFNRDVSTALFNVANQFVQISESAIPANNPIKRLSTDYYVVMINNEIDANLLEYLLTTEFEKRSIKVDFEYGIYDCANDEMVYGNYVSFGQDFTKDGTKTLPKWDDQGYYFGVQFPKKATIITNRMGVWIFSSSVLLLVIIFFAYAMFVILKQKRLSEIQKDFINNMTHEFKTPISTIAVSTEVLKNPAIIHQPERLLSYASIIENENRRLKNQVEHVLQMARMDKTDLKLEKAPISLHAMIDEVLKSMRTNLDENGIELACNLRAQNDQLVGDKLHLVNVLYNLLDNAIKYRGKEPAIHISTYNYKDCLKLEIKDNGIGIAKAHVKRIFDRFYRVPTGNIHDVKGFGIGLHYVHLVIKAHGGQIHVASDLGKETTFVVTLKNSLGH